MKKLSDRQLQILKIIKDNKHISGNEIADKIGYTRSALRTDFSILVNSGFIASKTNSGYTFLKDPFPIFVKDIMSEAKSVDTQINLYQAILHIFEKDLGNLIIVENNELKGMISRKDLLKASITSVDLEKIPVNMIMTRSPNIIYCREEDTISYAAHLIINHEIDALPVVREENNKLIVVGRFTKTNIAKLYVENL